MPAGQPPLSITLDGTPARHALLAYGTPSISPLRAIRADGSVVTRSLQQPIQFGSTVAPGPRDARRQHRRDPRVRAPPRRQEARGHRHYSYANGRMAPLARIERTARAAPWLGKKIGAHGFAARHVDFHPTRPWMYLCVERQGELHLYDCDDRGIAPRPRAIKSTLEV